LYSLEDTLHNENEVETISHALDGAIRFKQEGTKYSFSIVGITDVQTRSSVQYTPTQRELNVGAFALDRIR
ncbi:MAG: recombinase RecA, partial [Thermoplasmata archaeon]